MAKMHCEVCGYGMAFNARSCAHCRKQEKKKIKLPPMRKFQFAGWRKEATDDDGNWKEIT